MTSTQGGEEQRREKSIKWNKIVHDKNDLFVCLSVSFIELLFIFSSLAMKE